jgi:iron complex transport system substrate-binding protein
MNACRSGSFAAAISADLAPDWTKNNPVPKLQIGNPAISDTMVFIIPGAAMSGRFLLAAAIGAVFALCFWAQGQLAESRPVAFSGAPPERIVTMAPSVTEIVFALGLGDRVVGRTDYCKYPREALEKPSIGGYLNPNYERLVGLHPDLVILLEAAGPPMPGFHKLQLPALEVSHKDIEGIVQSIPRIGAVCGARPRAEAIVADIHHRLERVKEKTAGLPRPRVLVAIERTLGTGTLQDVYIAGHDGHIDRIVELAGGENAYQEDRARFPVVSREGIIKLDPGVIVDLVASVSGPPVDEARVRADWQTLPRVEAVRQGRVYLIADDFATVPGPRFVQFVEKLARLLHPEADWDR